MNRVRNLAPEIPLRIGLGAMYLYSGFDLLMHPDHWYGFAPAWFERALAPIFSLDSYLRLQGLGEAALGLLFLAWFLGARGLRIASLLATMELALILIFSGIDPITFRDLGLLGAAIASLALSSKDSCRTA